MLRALVLALHDQPGGEVCDAHRRIRSVDVLTTSPRCAVGVDLEVGIDHIDRDLVIDLGDNRDRHRRGVNAPLTLGRGHTLHAVCPDLVLQAAIDIIPLDHGDDLLIATMIARKLINDHHTPTALINISQIHPKKITDENRHLVTTHNNPDLNIDILLIEQILKNKQNLKLITKLLTPHFKLNNFITHQLSHLLIIKLNKQFF